MNDEQTIIFFLTCQSELPKEYFYFNALFGQQNFILVPVKVDQLQNLAASTDQEHIIVINTITKSEELKNYNKYARHLLKYVLKSKRISFFNISSFGSSNDTKVHFHSKNYFFINLPIDAKILSDKLIKYYELKRTEKIAWPGGKRAGLSSVGV
ncbi:MAG: hypothetical protein WDA09_02185 [Bacteriovoracaceae bacterium]